MRTNRHLKTIKSTHTRTLLYYCGIYTSIVLASIVQVRGPCLSMLRCHAVLLERPHHAGRGELSCNCGHAHVPHEILLARARCY